MSVFSLISNFPLVFSSFFISFSTIRTVEISSIIYKRITQSLPNSYVFGNRTLNFSTINIITTLYARSWDGTVKFVSPNTTTPSVTSSLMLLSHTVDCLQSGRRQHIFLLKFCLHLISFFYPIGLDYLSFLRITSTKGSYLQKFRHSNVAEIGYLFSQFTSYGYKYFPKTVFPFLVQHESYVFYTNDNILFHNIVTFWYCMYSASSYNMYINQQDAENSCD